MEYALDPGVDHEPMPKREKHVQQTCCDFSYHDLTPSLVTCQLCGKKGFPIKIRRLTARCTD